MIMLPTHLLDHAAAVLTTAFVAGLWQGAALMLLAAALLRLLPGASARLRHTLLLFSFAAALLLPFVGLRRAVAVTSTAHHALPVASWMAAAVASLWMAAAATRALQLLMAWRHLRNVRLHARPITVDGLAEFPAGSRHARLCASDAVDSPTILGFRHPALLLPEWMVPKLTSSELRQIALHECEHLRRYDDWLNLLLQIGMVLSPLNPALVWLNRRIGVQRELACDDAVIAATRQPIAYASCLARLAEQRMHHRGRLRLALAAWERQSELAQRVHALLQQTARWTPKQSGLASAGAAALLLSASAGLAHSPQLIRIVGAPVALATTVPAEVHAASASVMPSAEPTFTAVKMVRASFVPASLEGGRAAASSRSHAPSSQMKRRAMLPVTPPRELAAADEPRMLRTSGQVAPDGVVSTADLHDDEPVRFVTADFSSYVAVPTANGWLLIEL